MRLKLILLTSFVGAILGSGLPVLIITITLGRRGFLLAKSYPASDNWASGAILLIPVITALFSGIFTYRHTARRRKLQALLTGILVLVFSAVAFVAVTFSVNFL